MPTMKNYCDQGAQTNAGGSMQVQIPTGVHGIPATVPASGNVTSNLLPTDGMKSAAIGVTSTQAGVLTVQRYLDDAGTIPQGAALTTNLTANTAAVLNITDANPFASFTVNISNTSVSIATLSKLGILLQG